MLYKEVNIKCKQWYSKVKVLPILFFVLNVSS